MNAIIAAGALRKASSGNFRRITLLRRTAKDDLLREDGSRITSINVPPAKAARGTGTRRFFHTNIVNRFRMNLLLCRDFSSFRKTPFLSRRPY